MESKRKENILNELMKISYWVKIAKESSLRCKIYNSNKAVRDFLASKDFEKGYTIKKNECGKLCIFAPHKGIDGRYTMVYYR